MRKLLVCLVMLGMILGAVGVMALNQDVFVTPTGVVDFSVSPTLTFPSVVPGTSTSADSTLTLGVTNTEGLTVDISLTGGSDNIFTNVVLTTAESSISGLGSGPSLSKSVPITIGITDTDVEPAQSVQNKVVLATLSVPLGTLPTQKTGVITYTVTAPTP